MDEMMKVIELLRDQSCYLIDQLFLQNGLYHFLYSES